MFSHDLAKASDCSGVGGYCWRAGSTCLPFSARRLTAMASRSADEQLSHASCQSCGSLSLPSFHSLIFRQPSAVRSSLVYATRLHISHTCLVCVTCNAHYPSFLRPMQVSLEVFSVLIGRSFTFSYVPIGSTVLIATVKHHLTRWTFKHLSSPHLTYVL